jgi:hypothetical protein
MPCSGPGGPTPEQVLANKIREEKLAEYRAMVKSVFTKASYLGINKKEDLDETQNLCRACNKLYNIDPNHLDKDELNWYKQHREIEHKWDLEKLEGILLDLELYQSCYSKDELDITRDINKVKVGIYEFTHIKDILKTILEVNDYIPKGYGYE